jgi:hypothetical protein
MLLLRNFSEAPSSNPFQLMRIAIVCLSILGIAFLFSPLVLMVKPSLDGYVTLEADENVLLEDFNYSHWDAEITQEKEYTLSGKVLRIQDKPVWGIQYAFLKELAISNPQIAFYKHDENVAQMNAGIAKPKMDLMKGEVNFVNVQEMVFTDNPVLVSIQGRSFRCPQMTWNKTTDTIKGEGGCQLQWNNKVLQAQALIVNTHLTTWQVPSLN